MDQIKYIPIASLRPHSLNAQIYSDGCDQELLDDIKERGVRTPIEITKSLLIISGHRRLNAAQMVGLSEVPVIFSDVDENDQLAVEEALIKANIQRQKTPEQIAREYSRLKKIEEEKAKNRMLSGKINPTVNSSEGMNLEKGEAREIAAKKLGIGSQKAERSAKVVEKIDALKQQGQIEQAESLRKTLNEKSVNAAYNAIKLEKEIKMANQLAKVDTLRSKGKTEEAEQLRKTLNEGEAQKPKGHDEGSVDIAAINMKRIYYLASEGEKWSIIWASTDLSIFKEKKVFYNGIVDTGFACPDSAKYDTREEAMEAFRHYFGTHPCTILGKKEDSENERANQEIERLKKENSEYVEAEKTFSKFRKRIDDLEDENKRLKHEIDILKAEKEQFIEDGKEFRLYISRLEEENKKLKKAQAVPEQKQQQEEITKLKEEIEKLTKDRNHCKLMWEAEERHVRDVKEGAKEDQILVSDLVGKNAELTRQLEYYQNRGKGKNSKGMDKKWR